MGEYDYEEQLVSRDAAADGGDLRLVPPQTQCEVLLPPPVEHYIEFECCHSHSDIDISWHHLFISAH